MKFEVNAHELLKQLEPILLGCYQSENIWFNANNNGIEAVILTKKHIRAKYKLNKKENEDLQYCCHQEGSISFGVKGFVDSLRSFRKDTNIIIDAPVTATISTLGTNSEEQPLSIKNLSAIETVFDKKLPSKSFNIQRTLLVDALKSVRFAIGSEDWPKYYGILIEFDSKRMRFVGGNGGLFAAKSISYKKSAKVKTIESIFLSAPSISFILTTLNQIADENIKCYVNEKQLTICTRLGQLCIVNQFDATNNIYIDKILDYKFPLKLCLPFTELRYAVMGIAAGCKKNDGDIETAEMLIDGKKGYLYLSKLPDAQRKIPFGLNSVVDCNTDPISIKCQIHYLMYICQKWNTQNTLFMHAEDGNKPIMVKPEDKSVKAGEPDVIIFATSKR